jgi:hypothetical protein
MPGIVLGAYTREHLPRNMKKRSKQTAEKTRTGTKVPPSDEKDAESVPEDARRVTVPPEELSRLEPTLGSFSSLFAKLVSSRTRVCHSTTYQLPSSKL